MHKALIASLVTLLVGSPSHAACISWPDNASSENIRNNASKMLCLQDELSDKAARNNENARIRSDIQNAITMMELQRQMTQPPLMLPKTY